MKDYLMLQKKYIVPTHVNRGLVITKGSGMYLFDQDNNKYLDLMSNYGASILGHGYPMLVSRITQQAQKLLSLHGSFTSDVRAIASEALVSRCAEPYAQVFWSNSGSEAIEAALKFAMVVTGRKKFISAKNSFHGKTLGALSATGISKYREPFAPLLWNFVFHEYGNTKELKSLMNKEVAAVIVEPIQGDGGLFIPPPQYLASVRRLCDRNGALLIIDEIQTGSGRTGTFIASDGVDADILCLGKGLAGGMPVGATIVTSQIGSMLAKGIHSSTFAGSPLICAGVLAALETLTPSFLEGVRKKGTYFMNQLKAINSPLIQEVRGRGLMIGMEVSRDRDTILKRLQAEKILAIPAGVGVVRFLPPYIISTDEIDHVVTTLKGIVKGL